MSDRSSGDDRAYREFEETHGDVAGRRRGIRGGRRAQRRRESYLRHVEEETGVDRSRIPVVHSGGQQRPLHTSPFWTPSSEEEEEEQIEYPAPTLSLTDIASQSLVPRAALWGSSASRERPGPYSAASSSSSAPFLIPAAVHPTVLAHCWRSDQQRLFRIEGQIPKLPGSCLAFDRHQTLDIDRVSRHRAERIDAAQQAPEEGSSSSHGPPRNPTIELHRHESNQLQQELHLHDQRQLQQELHLHDQRSQVIAVGVGPEVFARTVGEAQHMLDEAETRASHFEGVARDLYQEANQRIMELKAMVEHSHGCNQSVGAQLEQMTASFESTREQLRQQIESNEQLRAEGTSKISSLTNMIGHKDSEIQRLMNELAMSQETNQSLVNELSTANDSRVRLEASLAASRAAPSASEAPYRRETSGTGSRGNQDQLAPLMEAFQALSCRMDSMEVSHNSTEHVSPSRLRPPVASSFPSRLVGFGGGGDDDGDGDGDDYGDGEEEELVPDSPHGPASPVSDPTERDLVDARALQHSRIEALPSSAADFRAWKTKLLLMIARLDISMTDYLSIWLSTAFSVSQGPDCQHSSGWVPRLDRWLAGELMKGCKALPELEFKIMGYVEGCTRSGVPPRGRYLLHLISRHFDLDRTRGSMLTSQSLFQLELHGYQIKDLQEFSSLILRTLNSIPQSEWPNRRMMGEWLFHKLRHVRKLDRTIDEIKRSAHESDLRNFDFLWSRMQELLFEEREDINAKSIEQALRPKIKDSPKNNPKPKHAASGAAAPKGGTGGGSLSPDVSAAPAKAKGPPPKAKSKGGKGSSKGKPKTAEEKARTPCIFHQMPNGCVHGSSCAYSHSAPSTSPPAKAKAEAKPKPKPKSGPKVSAVVALVTALSSVVCPSTALGSLEWAADSGAGRHLVSFEALQHQGS
eukprot:Skav215332  [mRNA]  locus=scaffold1391:90581:93539:- [translate_table: standard]